MAECVAFVNFDSEDVGAEVPEQPQAWILAQERKPWKTSPGRCAARPNQELGGVWIFESRLASRCMRMLLRAQRRKARQRVAHL
jgi:hypothetical protein